MKRRTLAVALVVALAAVAAAVSGLVFTGGKAAVPPRFVPNPEKAENPKATAIDTAGNVGEPDGARETQADGDTPTAFAEQDYANRAYPLDTIPASAQAAALRTWNTNYPVPENKDGSNLGNNPNQPNIWDLIGPTHARQPDVLSFSGHEYYMGGRVTAMAISPTCHTNADCRLWVAAAGGGIWRTDNPFSPDPKWVFSSQGFRSNAIGDIEVDPNDPTGNTLYAGTGEPNASADSEAGVGIYKSTDGGNTWTVLGDTEAQFRTRSIGKIAIVPGEPNHLFVGLTRGVRGVTSVAGGSASRTQGPLDGPDQKPLGLYESLDGGQTWAQAWDGNGSIRGVNDVGIDPNNPAVVYASAFQKGIWRRDPTHGELTFQQVFATGKPQENTSRTQFDLTTKDGNTRIYAVDGSVGPQFGEDEEHRVFEIPDSASGVWRVDDANAYPAAALLATQATPRDHVGWDRLTSAADRPRSAVGRETYDICTGQCWYDMDVFTPKDHPDIVYVIGSYQYNELPRAAGFESSGPRLPGPSNGRAVLYSQTAGDPDPSCNGCTFSDMTWDATPKSQPDQTHPDQHALITAPDNPAVYFEGSDGGVVRSDGQFADASDDCADRPLDDDSLVLCRKLLSRVPNQLYDTLNKGLSTLQFQSVSVDPKQPLHQVQGGTQDNGTFEWNSQLTTWDEEIYGDGGQSGYNYCNDKIRFNEFFDRYTDENFRDGFPKTWVITSGPLFNEGGSESAPFYMAQVTDYTNCGSVPGFDTAQAVALNANNTQNSQGNLIGPGRLGELGFQYLGMRHVWRTVDNGGPQDYLETNCIEFFVSGADRRCGDWKALAGPPGSGRPGDLASVNNYGGTKSGGSVVAVERDPGDSNTLWAATTAGRVFVTHNVNAVDPQAVQFCRLDDKDPHSPPRFVSSIYPDPANPNRAWISYSGYNSSTKDTPGHVFEVTATGAGSDGCPTAAVWRDLAVESGSTTHYGPADDIPILDLVRDDYTGTLYASTDFGVLQGTPSGANYVWTRAGSANFPFVAVSGLTIDPCSRVLYAATHGRSIWRMFLPAAKDAPSQGCPRTP